MTGVTTARALFELLANGVSGEIGSPAMVLGTNLLSPTRDSVIGDIVQPDYDGYIAVNFEWGDPAYDSIVGKVKMVGTTVLQFFGPDLGGGPVVRSWGLEYRGAGGPPLEGMWLIAAGNFDTGQTLASSAVVLPLTCEIWSDGTVNVSIV